MKKIKLDIGTKLSISMDIIMAVYEIIAAYFTKNYVWIICSSLWIVIAIIQYLDAKLLKSKDELFDIQNKIIENQNEMITAFIKDKSRTRIVMMEDIKIPKKFKKPGKEKMSARTEYFKTFHDFRVPVIIDKDNNLKDGYTSYLIAKSFGHNCISVKVD